MKTRIRYLTAAILTAITALFHGITGEITTISLLVASDIQAIPVLELQAVLR